MKKQFIIIILMSSSLFVFAQKGSWTIELYSGWGISLSGTYNMGVLLTDYLTYNVKLKELDTDFLIEEYDYHTYNRNQNWNVLLGVTYTFKKKEKKEK